MSFGNGKSQSEPADCQFVDLNNFCGGFAANAILSDLSPNTENPMETYQRIQFFQKMYIISAKINESKDFIINGLTSGTAMSLPSGICDALLNFKGKNHVEIESLGIFCTTSFVTKEDPAFDKLLPNEIAVLKDRIKEQQITIQTSGDYYPDINALFNAMIGFAYLLVLVYDEHWVAVKKCENGFECYDPAEGKLSNVKDTIIGAMAEMEYSEENISGLVIAVTSIKNPPQPVSSI